MSRSKRNKKNHSKAWSKTELKNVVSNSSKVSTSRQVTAKWKKLMYKDLKIQNYFLSDEIEYKQNRHSLDSESGWKDSEKIIELGKI